MGDPHRRRNDGGRGSACRSPVRGDIADRAQRALRPVHRAGALTARLGGFCLALRLSSAVWSGGLPAKTDHRPSGRPARRPRYRHSGRCNSRRLAMGPFVLGRHRQASRDVAAAAARSSAPRSCADLGGLRLCRAANAARCANQPRLRQDDRIAASFRSDLRHDAWRSGHHHGNARHVRLLARLHRIRAHLLRVEHGGADDDRDDCGLHCSLAAGAALARGLSRIAARAIIVLVAASVVIPILWTLLSGFKHRVDIVTPTPMLFFTPTLDNFLYVLERDSVRAGLINSIIVSGCSVLIGAAFGLPLAYAVARYPMRFANDIQFFVLSLRFLPPVAIAIPLIVIWLDVDLYDTRIALIVTYSLLTLATTIWLAIPAFKRVPNEIEEAAFVDGYGPYAIFFLIALPIAWKSLIGAIVFSFVLVWNEFLIALMLTTSDAKTLPVVASEMTQLGRDVPWGILNASVILLSLPPLLFLGVLSSFLNSALKTRNQG